MKKLIDEIVYDTQESKLIGWCNNKNMAQNNSVYMERRLYKIKWSKQYFISTFWGSDDWKPGGDYIRPVDKDGIITWVKKCAWLTNTETGKNILQQIWKNK